ncbi:MAG: YggT family protein [Clostridia bacterium]|nr:YggT family protein [Clostridia bacterium]
MNVAATLFYFLQQFVYVLINVIQLAMFVRAILSWFDPMQEWKISAFLFMVTEPVILPIRRLCEKMHWFEGVPIDIPFLLSWLVLMVIQLLVTSL